MQSLITENSEVASSVASGRSLNNGAGREITFCDALRDSFGGFPSSTTTVTSPPMISWPSPDSGDCVALCFVTGDCDLEFAMAGVEDRDFLLKPGVGAFSYVPFANPFSMGEPPSSNFISLSAVSTASGFTSRESSAISMGVGRVGRECIGEGVEEGSISKAKC